MNKQLLEALDFADRQAVAIKNDPNGRWGTIREATGAFAPIGEVWDMKKVWIPGSDWQAEALKVRDAQLAQEQQDMADRAETDSDHSIGITSRPLERSS